MKQQHVEFQIGIHSSTGNQTRSNGRPKENLDRYAVRSYNSKSNEFDDLILAIVADTWGWATGDEEWSESNPPSQIVIDSVTKSFEQPHDETLSHLDTSLRQVSNELQEMKLAWVTCIALAIRDLKLYVASAGDCRAFLFRNGDAKRISVAHTMAEILIERKIITLEELMSSIYDPKGPIRSLGGEETIPDLRLRLTPDDADDKAYANQGFELLPGDQLILTSGRVFYDYITPDEWQRFKQVFLDNTLTVQEAVDHFIVPLRKRNNVSDMTVLALRLIST